MDHFYQNIGEDWFSYAGFYRSMVALFPDGSRFVEVGCWRGRSAAFMAVEIVNQKKSIEFVCVDSWKHRENTEQPASSQNEFDDIYNEFLANTSAFDFIKTIRLESISAASMFPDGYFDFIFIDAGHHYDDVISDLSSWYPKLKSGGVIAGHDYFTRVHPEVREAVDTFFNYKIWCNPGLNIWAR